MGGGPTRVREEGGGQGFPGDLFCLCVGSRWRKGRERGGAGREGAEEVEEAKIGS